MGDLHPGGLFSGDTLKGFRERLARRRARPNEKPCRRSAPIQNQFGGNLRLAWCLPIHSQSAIQHDSRVIHSCISKFSILSHIR